MKSLLVQAAICISLCPFLASQQPSQSKSTSAADTMQSSAGAERLQAIRNAHTICVNSETVFLTVGTMDRALMNQKAWEQLGLNIVNDPKGADLQIQVNRVPFTHIHTYIVTQLSTGIVLASGRVRALDGVIAAGPMAEQIVKALAAARLSAVSASARGDL